MFLMDTNILSNAEKPKPLPRLARWYRRQATIAIPFPAILEIQQGIIDTRKSHPSKAAKLGDWLEELLESEFEYPEITTEVARLLADMFCCGPLKNFWYVNPESKKEKRPSQDLFIAAIAIVHDLPLATTNEKDFVFINRHFPIPGVYNPESNFWAVMPPGRLRWVMEDPELLALDAVLDKAVDEGMILGLTTGKFEAGWPVFNPSRDRHEQVDPLPA
jgi:predicted nucleic acid-binding protein